LSYWDNNKEFYEGCIDKASELNSQIRAGSISAQIPALVAMPNMNESFTTRDRRRHFKWVMPEQVSCIIAVRQMITPEYFQWRITWQAPGFEQVFLLGQNSQADLIAGRRESAVRVYKPFPGPHIIPDGLITADYTNTNYTMAPQVDEAYLQFKHRVQSLFSMQHDEEARIVMNQFPEYSAKWLQEFE
jgi:hypothetical protein